MPNRSIDSIYNILNAKLRMDSNLHSDFPRSYPGVGNTLFVNHNVVENSSWIRSDDGNSNIGIEGFRAYMQKLYAERA